jgi:peptide deformylase
MYRAPGIGLAGPQIGVEKQIFVYDLDDDPQVILNPVIVESSGEWVYDEGCLSIPGLFVEMLRPKQILVRGLTLAGEEVEVEADELLSRLFQHEVDHLNGVLMFDRMTPDQRESALSEYQRRADGTAAEPIHLKLA